MKIYIPSGLDRYVARFILAVVGFGATLGLLLAYFPNETLEVFKIMVIGILIAIVVSLLHLAFWPIKK